MNRKRSRYVVLFAAVLVAVLATGAVPAGAILAGQQDTGNSYANVGMIQYQMDDVWYVDGTATLVKNDGDGVVVLTAAHCVEWVIAEGGIGLANLRVTFDPMTDGAAAGDTPSTFYQVKRAEVHPAYLAAIATMPYIGDSKRFGIGPGREDEALLWLDVAGPVSGMQTAQVVAQGGLAGIDLKDQTFTVVGYGTNGFVAGNGWSFRNPNTVSLWSGRNYKDAMVVSVHDAFGDRYLKLTSTTGFGDSGGPTFLGDSLVALTIWGESSKCTSPSYQYRLDTPSAQDFLKTYLGDSLN